MTIDVTEFDVELGSMADLTATKAAELIGIPLEDWPGNCYGIAMALVEKGVLEGRPIYGHFRGEVSPRCEMFYDKPIIPHGWVEVDEDSGRIVDPTRWVFEARSPYLYIGESPSGIADPCAECGALEEEHEDGDYPTGTTCLAYLKPVWDYDEGGNQFRLETMSPSPEWDPADVQYALDFEDAMAEIALRSLLGPQRKGAATFSRAQCFWLANAPLQVLGPYARPLFEALDRGSLGALVPIDNREKVMR